MSSDDMLTEYKSQLSCVEESLKHSTGDSRTELLDLKAKLIEVIALMDGPVEQSNSEEDEFLKFQKEINDLENHSSNNKGEGNDAKSNQDETEANAHEELFRVLSALEGEKCRAPFVQPWGERGYHNAIVFSSDVEELDDINDVQVKVMFCNPTCDLMKPCPFFLEGHCKFDEDDCRYSHGYSVRYTDLEEYILPDYNSVSRDTRCLAKGKDGLWCAAIVESCLDNHEYFVKYSSTGDTDVLAAQHVLPLDDFTLSDDDDSDSSENSSKNVTTLAFDGIGTFNLSDACSSKESNYIVEVGSSSLGQWEQYTKGIGSKLMAKMGYIPGQGLGKNSDGRIEPVEAMVLPKGKSLDKCAEIRDARGPISVEDRFNSEQAKEKQLQKKRENVPECSVFAFLNRNLSRRDSSNRSSNKKLYSGISQDKSKKSQSTDLNFEMYSVGEAIKNARKEVNRLQQSLERNSEKNETSYARMKQKMALQNSLLHRLEAKEKRIGEQINMKKTDKKISVF